MRVVFLYVSGHAVDVLQEKRQQWYVIPLGQSGIHRVELCNVVGTIVWWQRDSGERDLRSAGLQLFNDARKILLGLFEFEAAQTVIPAELDDDQFGVLHDDTRNAVQAVFGGVAAYAGVRDTIVEACLIKPLLEIIRVALARIRSVACGQAIAETDDHRPIIDRSGCWLGLDWNRGIGVRVLLTGVSFTSALQQQGGCDS